MPDESNFWRFSTRELFADDNSVDAEWLDTLETGAKNPATAMLFFLLAGFWRQNYKEAIVSSNRRWWL